MKMEKVTYNARLIVRFIFQRKKVDVDMHVSGLHTWKRATEEGDSSDPIIHRLTNPLREKLVSLH